MPICESQSWNQGYFLTTPHWKPSTDGTVNPNGLQDLKTKQPGGLSIREDSFDIVPFVIRFSHQGKTIAELAKATCKLHQSAYPDIYTPRFITAFSKNKNLNLKDMLVSTKLQ